MRHHSESRNFLDTLSLCYLYVTMRKIAGAYASICSFPRFSSYGALPFLHCDYSLICGSLRPYIRHYAVFQGFVVAVQYLFLLVMQCIFRVINRITTHDVILFIEYEDHDTHKNGCNPHHFFLVLRTLELNHSLK